MNIRKLKPGDEQALESFLRGHPETSMFLRGNLRRSGIAYSDAPYHGEYLGSFAADGSINGVLAHYWNHNIMMQAPDPAVLDGLVDAFRGVVNRKVGGVIGHDQQSLRVISRLGLDGAAFALNRKEQLHTLDLAELKTPAIPGARIVPASDAGRALLSQWFKAYEMEALGTEESPELDARVHDRTQSSMKDSADCWALEVNGAHVALSGFNARLPDTVQIGPVWTPPEHRSNGYARAIVAMTLETAKKEGVAKAILFTDNPPAIKAYEAIGFRQSGDFRIAMLKKPVALTP